MKKKNGFIAISIIYSFFLVFIALLASMLTNYVYNRSLVRKINKDVIASMLPWDINLKNAYISGSGVKYIETTAESGETIDKDVPVDTIIIRPKNDTDGKLKFNQYSSSCKNVTINDDKSITIAVDTSKGIRCDAIYSKLNLELENATIIASKSDLFPVEGGDKTGLSENEIKIQSTNSYNYLNQLKTNNIYAVSTCLNKENNAFKYITAVSDKTKLNDKDLNELIVGIAPDIEEIDCKISFSIYSLPYKVDNTAYQEKFTPGIYQLELWGAKGGSYNNYSSGQNGGYVKGILNINSSTYLEIYVGGTTTSTSGGFNGGESPEDETKTMYRGGGGATDVRLKQIDNTVLYLDSTKSPYYRLMVAGGGQGYKTNTSTKTYSGGKGGGWFTGAGTSWLYTNSQYNTWAAGDIENSKIYMINDEGNRISNYIFDDDTKSLLIINAGDTGRPDSPGEENNLSYYSNSNYYDGYALITKIGEITS